MTPGPLPHAAAAAAAAARCSCCCFRYRYLHKYGQHVDSLEIWGRVVTVYLHHLPPNLQLTSLVLNQAELHTTLELHNPGVEMHPDYSWQGVLAAAGPHLKQLRLRDCTLLDGSSGLAAALALLPGLESLSVDCPRTRGREYHVHFPTQVLQQLQQLTMLELSGNWLLS